MKENIDEKLKNLIVEYIKENKLCYYASPVGRWWLISHPVGLGGWHNYTLKNI